MKTIIVVIICLLGSIKARAGYENQRAAILITQAQIPKTDTGAVVGYFKNVVLSYHPLTGTSGIAFDEDQKTGSWMETQVNDSKEHVFAAPEFIHHLRKQIPGADLDPTLVVENAPDTYSTRASGYTEFYLVKEAEKGTQSALTSSYKVYMGARTTIAALHKTFTENPARIYVDHFHKMTLNMKIVVEEPGLDANEEPVAGELNGFFLVTLRDKSSMGQLLIPPKERGDGAIPAEVAATNVVRHDARSVVIEINGNDFFEKVVSRALVAKVNLEPLKGNTPQAKAPAARPAAKRAPEAKPAASALPTPRVAAQPAEAAGSRAFEPVRANFTGSAKGKQFFIFYAKAVNEPAIKLYRIEMSIVGDSAVDLEAERIAARAAAAPPAPHLAGQSAPSTSANQPEGQPLQEKPMRLGVTFDSDFKGEGAKVTEVHAGYPAEKFLHKGDIVVWANNHSVKDCDALMALVEMAGDVLEVKVEARPTVVIDRYGNEELHSTSKTFKIPLFPKQ
ncbi:MAG: hypothetical protein HY537_16945 [Deltaproteobacteria bacterium]|nr:hypothetical protein [Deltaproteobacteria bacterium]